MCRSGDDHVIVEPPARIAGRDGGDDGGRGLHPRQSTRGAAGGPARGDARRGQVGAAEHCGASAVAGSAGSGRDVVADGDFRVFAWVQPAADARPVRRGRRAARRGVPENTRPVRSGHYDRHLAPLRMPEPQRLRHPPLEEPEEDDDGRPVAGPPRPLMVMDFADRVFDLPPDLRGRAGAELIEQMEAAARRTAGMGAAWARLLPPRHRPPRRRAGGEREWVHRPDAPSPPRTPGLPGPQSRQHQRGRCSFGGGADAENRSARRPRTAHRIAGRGSADRAGGGPGRRTGGARGFRGGAGGNGKDFRPEAAERHSALRPRWRGRSSCRRRRRVVAGSRAAAGRGAAGGPHSRRSPTGSPRTATSTRPDECSSRSSGISVRRAR